VFAAGVFLAVSALGQAAKSFEVATVKPSAPLDIAKLQAQVRAGQTPNFGAHFDGLRAEYTYMTMQQLLIYAYKLKNYNITGPDWLISEHYDIVARLPEGSSTNDAPEMLRNLLADRFKLAAHLEDKDQPVYALVVGKDGPKLKDSPEQPPVDLTAPLKPGEQKQDLPDGPAIISGNPSQGQATVNMGERGVFLEKIDMQSQAIDISGKGVTIPGFVDMLNQVMQLGGAGAKQVVDRTSLKGHYEVALQLSLADIIAAMRRSGIDMPNGGQNPGGGGGAPGAAPASAPGAADAQASDPGGGGGSTITSSVEKLGLKLESSRAPVQQLIVDHVEKTPTEN
jgi:uncharacterized protein (TIGR03435 family)